MKKKNSTHRQCAERLLVEDALRVAHRKGVPRHRRGQFLRRHLGTIVVGGRHQTTRPCQACCCVLAAYGLTVCYLMNGIPISERADNMADCELKGSDKVRYGRRRIP